MASPTSDSHPERRLAAIARILKSVRETDEFERLVSTLLKHLQDEFHYTVLWLGLYDRNQQSLVNQGFIAPHSHRLLESSFSLTAGDLMEQVLVQQRPLFVNELRLESRIGDWRHVAETFALQGALLLPIRRRHTCYGLLFMGTPQWGQTFTASDRSFLSIMGGTLAEVLHEQEHAQQVEASKDPGSAILELINQLQPAGDCDEQLELVARALFQFIEPSRVRIFWLDASQFEFWERLTLSSDKPSGYRHFTQKTSNQRLSPDDFGNGYQVLTNQQLLVVDKAQSSLMAVLPERLLQTLQAQALMLAPLLHRQTLIGLISIEHKADSIWSASSYDYLATVANLVGLLVPTTTLEALRQQSMDERELLTGMVRSIQSDADWHNTLEQHSQVLCQQLNAQQLVVLSRDPQQDQYTVVFHKSLVPRKGPLARWEPLDPVDRQMLEQSSAAISINDLDTDLRLVAWQSNFQALEARSVLVCRTSLETSLAGMVLVMCPTPRYWTPAEGHLVQQVAQQVGLILHQWQLQQQTHRQAAMSAALQRGLVTLQQTVTLSQLETTANQQIVDLLDISLAVLVSWSEEPTDAQIQQALSRHHQFTVNPAEPIRGTADAVISWALQTHGPLAIAWQELPADTRRWLLMPPDSQLLIIALRTHPEQMPTGIWLLGTQAGFTWSPCQIQLVTLLTSQLAWSRQFMGTVAALTAERQDLEVRNWQLDQQLDGVSRRLDSVLQRLKEPTLPGNGLSAQHQYALQRDIETLSEGIQAVRTLPSERNHRSPQTVPVTKLVNRLLEDARELTKEKQLWIKVHADSNAVIRGNISQLDLALFQIMAKACERSPEQGRLDIWCRPLNQDWLELSITDDGDIAEPLLPPEPASSTATTAAESASPPTTTQFDPSLQICQRFLQEMGTEFSLQKLEDGRTISRLVLAIST